LEAKQAEQQIAELTKKADVLAHRFEEFIRTFRNNPQLTLTRGEKNAPPMPAIFDICRQLDDARKRLEAANNKKVEFGLD
jgi:hypothetical protein